MSDPGRQARIAGVFYLLTIVTGSLALASPGVDVARWRAQAGVP